MSTLLENKDCSPPTKKSRRLSDKDGTSPQEETADSPGQMGEVANSREEEKVEQPPAVIENVTSSDADDPPVDGGDVSAEEVIVSLEDFVAEEDALEADARAVLGPSDSTKCSYGSVSPPPRKFYPKTDSFTVAPYACRSINRRRQFFMINNYILPPGPLG